MAVASQDLGVPSWYEQPVTPERIFDEFPAPSYRGNQEQALRDIRDAYLDGNDVVLVRAPTGSGKSLLARAVAGCARNGDEAEPSEATGAYYTTPQVSQLDDVAGDSLLEDLNVIRGKSNYNCILPHERNTPVNQAPCVRENGYDCAVVHRCPYFSDRSIASNRKIAAMTLAYFMQTAGSDVFRKRDVVVIDEAHGLAEWAEMYATIHLGPRTIPIWDDIRLPTIDGIERAVRYAESLSGVCRRRLEELRAQEQLSAGDVRDRDRLQELESELRWFVSDYRDPESHTTWLVDQAEASENSTHSAETTGEGTTADPDESMDGTETPTEDPDQGGPITIKPMDPARYLTHTVWDRGNRFALFSATILDKDAFCRQVGLDPSTVALVDVPHTFPLEHRPVYDVTQGKMTYDQRSKTLPAVARVIVRIMQAHQDEKGLVHAHSYAIQEQLCEHFEDFGVGDRIRAHTRDDRDGALEDWKATDEPTVFCSVKMEEALDLKDDYCRWQVICKAPFLNTSDSRVAHRLEEGNWAWYYRSALRTVIQACGRVVRSPDDYGVTYLADESLLDLFDRARGDLPPWFAEQVDHLERPDLPPFDPAEAISIGEPGASGERNADILNRGDTTRERSRNRPRRSRSGGGSDSKSPSRNRPLSDVWDVE